VAGELPERLGAGPMRSNEPFRDQMNSNAADCFDASPCISEVRKVANGG
jgi:hypothetical protein